MHDDGKNLFHPGEAGASPQKGGAGGSGNLALDLDKVGSNSSSVAAQPGRSDSKGDVDAPVEPPSPSICNQLLIMTDGTWFNVIITIATMYALFGDDLRLWLTDKSVDNVFFALSSVALALFAFEFIVNCFARPYFACPPSFFFYLDLVATLSLLPDIGWIWDEISGSGTDLSDVRAGRAARAGTRAGRIVRIIRLVRLIRIVKLYKSVKRTGVLKRRRSSTLVVGVDGQPLRLDSARGGGDASSGLQQSQFFPQAPDGLVYDPQTRMARSSIVQPYQGYGGRPGAQPGEVLQSYPSTDIGRPETPVALPGGKEGAQGHGGAAAASAGGSAEVAEIAEARAGGAHATVVQGAVGQDEEDEDDEEEKPHGSTGDEGVSGGKISKVGQVLSDITTRRVIVLILLMLIVVPFLEGEPDPLDHYREGGLQSLHRLPQDLNVSQAQFRDDVETYARFSGRIVYLEICPPPEDASTPESERCQYEWETAELLGWIRDLRFEPGGTGVAPTDGSSGTDVNPINEWEPSFLETDLDRVFDVYRTNEVVIYQISRCFEDGAATSETGCVSTVVYDVRHEQRVEAIFSICKTLFVMVVILLGAGLFTRDSEVLVIRPIERMAFLMRKLASNPLTNIQVLRRNALRVAPDSDEEDEEDYMDDDLPSDDSEYEDDEEEGGYGVVVGGRSTSPAVAVARKPFAGMGAGGDADG